MKLLVSLVVLIVGINIAKGHSLSKIELKNPTDIVYKIEEGKDTNAITIVNQKPEQPTLREIIYYHIIEKSFGSKKEVPEGPDFDDTRRPFTNGHGYQYLAYDPEDEFEEKTTSTPEEVITEVTPKEVTTKPLLKDSTIATEISSKRLKREAKTTNEDNSASDDVSDQSRYRGIASQSYEDSVESDYTSHEPASQSHEDYHESVENSNEEDLSQSNDDLKQTNEEAGIPNEVSSEECDEVWNSLNEPGIGSNEISSEDSIEDLINGEAEYQSSEDSNEFDHIFSDINDVFTDNDNKLPRDIQHVNVLNILKDIFDDIVNKQTDKPILIMDSEDGNKKSSILKILHGLFTNIIKNDITITNNNMVSAKPDLVSNKDKDGTTEGNNPAVTEIPLINTDTPVTTEIVELPHTTSNINTESTTGLYEYTDLATEDTTSKGTTIDVTNIVTGTNNINDGVTTGIDKSTIIPDTDGNVHETGKGTPVTGDPTNDKTPTWIGANTESKPVHNNDKPDVNKLDVMAELMNNEKFWTFMGDLAGKYLEQLMARTGLFIKHEIENQLKEQLEAMKEETSKEDKKELPLDSDKVTNVYVFYLHKNSEFVMEEVKKIVKGNNGTHIFTFGIDSTKDNASKVTDNEIEVTVAPGTDLTENPSTVLMEETTANILNTEPTTGLVETTANDILAVTTDKLVINDVTDTNGGGMNEWLDHITTENKFETIATESPLTTETNTVSDKTTNGITDITTTSNDITEEITPVTENTMTTTAENEITVTVTVSDSTEVILNSEPTTELVETTTNDIVAITTDKFVINDVTDTNGGGLSEWLDIYRTKATESPLTTATNTVTDKTATDITDITTINNDITEEITGVTENTIITAAENEITIIDSDEVTTESGSVTTSADDSQVVINTTVSVPVTKSTTKAEIELTTEYTAAFTDSETVTNVSGNIETSTNPEITTENDIPTRETSENDITTVTSEIISSTDSQTFTTQSESEVTTESTITENTLITDENTIPTTETPEILTVNNEAIADVEPTKASPDNSDNIHVTTVTTDNVTEKNKVSDEPTTSSNNIDLNTEETNENKDSAKNKPDNNEITTEDNTSDNGINEVDSTEVTTDRDDENVASKENNTDKDRTR